MIFELVELKHWAVVGNVITMSVLIGMSAYQRVKFSLCFFKYMTVVEWIPN